MSALSGNESPIRLGVFNPRFFSTFPKSLLIKVRHRGYCGCPLGVKSLWIGGNGVNYNNLKDTCKKIHTIRTGKK